MHAARSMPVTSGRSLQSSHVAKSYYLKTKEKDVPYADVQHQLLTSCVKVLGRLSTMTCLGWINFVRLRRVAVDERGSFFLFQTAANSFATW